MDCDGMRVAESTTRKIIHKQTKGGKREKNKGKVKEKVEETHCDP